MFLWVGRIDNMLGTNACSVNIGLDESDQILDDLRIISSVK
jgi:hypothetical protein